MEPFPVGLQLKTFAARHWPAIIAALFVVAIDTFDSFGLDSASDEQTAQIIGTATAPFYGGSERRGQKAVTVVLIDDASLDHLGWPTPPPYQGMADIVSQISMYEPTAIFLDFSYTRPHGDNAAQEIESFRARLADMEANGGPRIMIGEVAPPEAGQPDVLAPLRRLTSVGVQWRDVSWLNYPMEAEAHREMAGHALARAYCERADQPCGAWRPPSTGKLNLTWGYGTSELAARVNGRVDADGNVDDPCVLPNTQFATRLGFALRESFASFSRAFLYDKHRGDPREARCIYTDTVNAATLLESADVDAMTQLFKNRVVLVGASHRMSADLQTIPHIGVVPGVYVHAMAVDNLIEQQGNYTRPPPPGFLDLDVADMVEILLSAALFLMMLFVLRAVRSATRAGDSESTKALRRRLIFAGAICVGVIFVLATVAIELSLHWPPLNIFGVAVLVTFVFTLVQRHSERLERDEESDKVKP